MADNEVQDEAYGPDERCITVSPAETGIRIVLKKAEKAMVGRSDGAPVLTLGTDVHAAHERLRGRGVRLLGEPYRSRGASGRCYWIGTVVPYSCIRNRMDRSRSIQPKRRLL